MFISKCSFNPIRRLRFTQGDRQETGSVRSRPRWHGTGSQRRRLQAQETSMYLNLNFCFYWFTHHFWSLTLLNQPRCSPLKKASSTRFVSILLCSAKLSMALNTFRRHTDSAFQVIELHLTHTLKCASVVLRKYIIYLLCTAERGWNIDSSLVFCFFLIMIILWWVWFCLRGPTQPRVETTNVKNLVRDTVLIDQRDNNHFTITFVQLNLTFV